MSTTGRRDASSAKSKGTRKSKAPQPSSAYATKRARDNSDLPIEVQQLMLDIFAHSFRDRLEDDISSVLQEVKKHLYERDFLTAFGRDVYLEAYAARWSPGRALGYLRVLRKIALDHLNVLNPLDSEIRVLRVASLGGGAGAEIAALAGTLSLLQARLQKFSETLEEPVHDHRQQSLRFECLLLDIAKWDGVVKQLYGSVVTAPPVSQYATDAAKAASRPLLARDDFDVDFKQADVLDLSRMKLKEYLCGRDLITIFFTLNELYTTSLPKTQAFLINLTAAIDPGALLLVIDSAGSYSTVGLNGKQKKYPMHWLLDHALLKPPPPISPPSAAQPGAKSRPAEADAAWEKIEEEESQWFRVPATLRYPLELENMRYQLHLYRRL